MKTELFAPVASESRLHPGFKALATLDGYLPARTLLKDVWTEFVDRDGNFVEQFQTTGFDSRIWELYLFAFLWDSANADFNWEYESPDFVVDISGNRVCVEAVTANASQLPDVVEREATADSTTAQRDHYPVRLGSALFSKLNKRYWELPHVAAHPLVIAIEDFHEAGSLHHTSASLRHYLYGERETWDHDDAGTLQIQRIPIAEHRHGPKRVPSGFFSRPDSDNISAVLYGNSGTVAAFNRLGFALGYGHERIAAMIRRGVRYDPTPNKAEPVGFAYDVGSPNAPREGWHQGLELFHNPNALYPLPIGVLPCAYHFMDGGILRGFYPDFHPYSSQTVTIARRS
jgi:hypothetical protein